MRFLIKKTFTWLITFGNYFETNEPLFSLFSTAPPPPIPQAEPVNPCVPNPCGPNSACIVSPSNTPSCSCLEFYQGAPPHCRPECVSNSDCPSTQACINQKCRDPCPGSCGLYAECQVVAHIPNCICQNGYVGDPFTVCTLKPSCKIETTEFFMVR